MIRRRFGSAGIAALALTLVAAGCGSDSKLTTSGPAATAPAPTTPAASATTTAAAAAGTATTSPSTATPPTTTAGSTNTVPATSPGAAASGSSPTAGDVDPALDDDIQTATGDLAAHLGIDQSAIEILSASTTEWPTGALGCPRPGMAYTQVPVDGAEIVLRAGGKQYSYHEGGSKGPFLCEQTATKMPGMGSQPSMVTMLG